MGSLEDLFTRHEATFSTLKEESKIIDWLSGDGTHGPKSSYRWIGREFGGVISIREEAEEEADLDRLRSLKKELRSLRIEDTKTTDIIEKSIDTAEEVQSEEERITKEITEYRDRLDKIESLPKEEIKDLYKTGNKEERLLARIALKEESPYSLRSFKGWETRKAGASFRAIFG